MPYFSSNRPDDIQITPGEFIDACSSSEISRLLDELSGTSAFNQKFGDPDELEDLQNEKAEVLKLAKNVRSQSHRNFLYYLQYLKYHWWDISKEDSEIIANVAKKQGAL